MNKELNAAEAVYGFVGWLTTREERTVMSAKDDCAPIAELIKRFCTENNLPEVSDQWPLNLIHPSGEVAVPNAAGMGDPLVTAAPAAVAEPDEIDRLRAALVYVAFALHDTPQYMLAEGVTLIDGDMVRVSRDGWTVEASNPLRQPEPQPSPTAQEDALDAAFEAVRLLLCGLERYSFVLDDDGVVRRVRDRVGNWIEFDAAHELFDPAAVDAAIAAKQGGPECHRKQRSNS